MSSLFTGVLQNRAETSRHNQEKGDEPEFVFYLLVDSAVYPAPDAIYLISGALYHENNYNRYKHQKKSVFDKSLAFFAVKDSGQLSAESLVHLSFNIHPLPFLKFYQSP